MVQRARERGISAVIVSESSLGATWALNSGENRLTPWRNDPVFDTPSEALYLRDEETAAVWSPTPRPAGRGRARRWFVTAPAIRSTNGKATASSKS